MLTETNELSDVLTIEYDGLGRVTSVEDREGNETSYSYDAIGQLKEIEDALGNDTDYTYNNRGWVTEILRPDPDGVGTLSRPKTEYDYDAAGNLESIGESRFGTAPYEFTYDDAGRKTDLDRDGLTSVAYTYDDLNRLTEVKVGEQYGLETQYEYNWRGQVTSITESGYEVLPEGILSPTVLERTWTLSYDDAGQLLEEVDPRGNATAYVYNSRGLISEIYAPDPDGSSPETSGPQLPSRTSFEYDDTGRLIEIQDPLLRTTSYAYNSRDWVTQITLPDPDGTGSQTSAIVSMTYDDAGNVLTETDPLSQVTTYTYDDEGRLLTITGPDPDGTGSLSQPVMTYTYNAMGSVLTLTEPGGAETSWDYDNLQRVIEITEPDPDGAGSLTSPVTTIEYGSNTLISEITDPLSRETAFQYDAYGNRTSITDDSGNTTTYTYDDEHLVTSVLGPDPDGAGPQTAPETEYTYSVFNQVIAAIDPNDGMTVYEYDDAGNLISLTDPEDNETTFAYDGQGRLTLETNEQGDYRSYEYDLASNLTRLRDRNGRVLRYYHDNLDQITSETWRSSADPGPELEIETTSQGGPVDEVQRVGYTDMMLFGGTFTLTYSGQTTSAISHGASAATVQAALESLSNIDSGDVSVTKSEDTFTEQEWTVDYQGSLAGTNVSQMTIDASNILGGMGTLVETEATDTQGSQSGGNETQTVTLANATGGTFRLAFGGYLSADLDYDATASEVEAALEALNAIDDVTVTGNAGGPWTVTYGGDQEGEDVSRLDGDVTGATTGTLERTISYTYDAAGQLTAASDPDSSYAITYDNLGRVTEVDNNNTTGVPRVILDTTYNAAGNRATLAATVAGADDFLNTYTYDDLHRLTKVTQDSQTGGNTVADKRVDFAYNAIGQFTSIARYNDVAGGSTNEVATGTYTYDTLGRLTGLAYTKGGTNLFTAYGWTYDSLSSAGMSFGGGNGASDPRVAATAASAVYSAPGRVTQMTGQDGTSAYSYDITNQLTAATHTFQTNESYSYDDNGNRDMTGYQTGDDNQMTNDGTYSYTYDEEGNRTRRTNTSTNEVTDYEWDYRNRLTNVTEKNSSGTTIQVVEYIYDVFNRRIGKEVDTTSPFTMADAVIERYVHDDIHNSLASLDGSNVVLDFVDADASDSTPIAMSKRYLHGNAVDQILAQEDVTKTLSDTQRVLWPLADNLGTVRDLAKQDGTIAVHYKFDAYGNVTSGDTSVTRYLFTGREFDSDVDLQYNRARWYDPETGRWISEDPIGFVAGDANLYRYVGNGPTNATDPSGLEWGWWPVFEGFWIGAGQGVANIGNGLTDTAIGIGNLPAAFVNGIAWTEEKVGILPKDSLRVPYIPVPDWSKGLVCHESEGAHNVSKIVGAGGVEIVTGAWIAKVSKARAAAVVAQKSVINPKAIRFSQDSISSTFKNGDSVADLTRKLKNGTVDPSSIPPIRVVERNGKLFTLDNRRLKAFQEAGIDIPFQRLDSIPKRELYKFTTENDGIDIITRGQ